MKSTTSCPNVELKRVAKLKYLGCYFYERSCKIDISYGIGKFYGNLNNIMSVVGYNKNEMATLHLVKTYCIPTGLYGCETWHLDHNDYQRLNVVWNNSFRRIFDCCWRETVSSLQFYCHTLPMSYIIDQRKILFWKNGLNCDNKGIRTLVMLNKYDIGKILSKYCMSSIYMTVGRIKNCMWSHFVDSCQESHSITLF